MKPSEILIQAAENIDSRKAFLSCLAIKYVESFKDFEENIKIAQGYFSIFNPDEPNEVLNSFWFGSPYFSVNQEYRVFALLTAAAMAESEGQ